MGTFLRYIFFICLLPLMGCAKIEFKLDFNLAKEVTENYNVTYYATDKSGGLTVQAVASVRLGRCELIGKTKKTTLVYITTRKSNFPLVVWADKGEEINISGNDNNPLAWKVGTAGVNKELSEWRTANLTSLVNNETDSVNSAVKNFVVSNPENPVSTILLECYFSRSRNEMEYAELMGALKGAAKSPDLRKMIARTDYTGPYVSFPAKLESMIMRSPKEEGDTLIIDNKNPLLVLFWQPGGEDKAEMVDSIKKLIKEFPEAAPFVADVCLDIDSTAWRNSIRRDSLNNVKRFWAPKGLADETVGKLHVSSIPYYIVFDKDGRQSYRGRDLGDALSEYRKKKDESK